MSPEDLLLWGALLFTLAAFGEALRRLVRPHNGGDRSARFLGVATTALFIAMALLLAYFLWLNLSVEYVFSYTSRQTPWYYRVAGLWAGQKGTLLIWTSFAALFLWLNETVWRRRVKTGVSDPDSLRRVLSWILLVGLGVVACFEALLLLGGTFDRTDPYLLQVRPSGTGLQPVLRTPFMMIHPPLQFIGYAFTPLLFAGGIAAVTTGRREWADVVLPWTRWAFVIATIGLGLGGLWAYYVLNFGGYWAWDPVETANLIAWFPLLLLLHAVIFYRKRSMFAATAPLFAVLTLIADLFASLATRTGLWVSVHAFTDPSQNFARDPLLRMLNILETGILLQWLASLWISTILVALAAYVWRLRADAAKSSSARAATTTHLLDVALGLLGAGVVLAFLNVSFLLSALFQLADLIALDNAHVGLAVLAFGAALVFASPGLTAKEEAPARQRPWLERFVNTPQLVFLGVVLLGLAFLVTFLLQILSVNGYERGIYDDRAPLVALPILLVMPSALAHPFLGRRVVVLLSALAAGLGVLLALVRPDQWRLLLVLPAFAWALVGTTLKLFKVNDLGATLDARLRTAGGLLLFGGILAMVYWANPPSRISFGIGSWHPSAWWAPVGYGLGLVSLLCSVGVLRAKTKWAHRVGGVALTASVAFGLGPVLGAAALVLAESRLNRFPDARSRIPMRACILQTRREVRKAGVYLIHVSLVLGLLGFALSTYAFGPETEVTVAQGQTVAVHGYDFRLVGSEAGPLDPVQRQLREVSGLVEVRRGGLDLGRAPLTMWLELDRHYAERVTVLRYTSEDVYLRPVEFVTPERTFLAHEDNVVLTSGRVDAVTFTVKTLPGMHLVWAGLWMIGTGMLLNLTAGAARFELSAPRSSSE